MTKVNMIVACEQIQEMINKNDYKTAMAMSMGLYRNLRKEAQEKNFEAVPIDNKKGDTK